MPDKPLYNPKKRGIAAESGRGCGPTTLREHRSMSQNDDSGQDSFECPNRECERTFSSRRGANCHASRYCEYETAWNDEQRVRELRAEGHSIESIATELGTSGPRISELMREWGMEVPTTAESRRERRSREPVNFYTHESGYEEWQHCWRNETPKQVRHHRLLAVAEYGFKALEGNIVHHGKGGGRLPATEIPWANWRGNLEMMTHADHMTHHKTIPKEELLAEIRRLEEALNRRPRTSDMTEKGRFGVGTYTNKFGSWTQALEAAGFKADKLVRITEEELFQELQRLTDELGHSPTKRDMAEIGEYGDSVYRQRFGSWSEALRESGVAE